MSKRNPGETRGQKGLPPDQRKQQRSIGLRPAEWARVQATWRQWTRERIPFATFLELLIVSGCHSDIVRSLVYADSGLQDRDEAAENAADYAEAQAMIARGEVSIGPATTP